MSITATPTTGNGSVSYHHHTVKAQEIPSGAVHWNVFAELGEDAAQTSGHQGAALIEALTGSIDGEQIPRPGVDFTFAPDMSISIAAVAQDARIAQAHENAVVSAIARMATHSSVVRAAAHAEPEIAEDAKHVIYRLFNA